MGKRENIPQVLLDVDINRAEGSIPTPSEDSYNLERVNVPGRAATSSP